MLCLPRHAQLTTVSVPPCRAMLKIQNEDKAMVEQLRYDQLPTESNVRADLPQIMFRKLRQQVGTLHRPAGKAVCAALVLALVSAQLLRDLDGRSYTAHCLHPLSPPCWQGLGAIACLE